MSTDTIGHFLGGIATLIGAIVLVGCTCAILLIVADWVCVRAVRSFNAYRNVCDYVRHRRAYKEWLAQRDRE